MPKFRVLVRQFVEEVGEVTLEAETEEKARELGAQLASNGDVDWEDGEDSRDHEVYAVYDEAGEMVWENT